MDIEEVTNAITISGMPKEVIDHIWIEKKNPFQITR